MKIKKIHFSINALLKFIFVIIFTFVLFISADLFASNAGSRGSFTRSGWVGARYVAMGMAADVLVDDVYAIYWNPAGLSELKGREKLTIDEIKDQVRKGKVNKIPEDDLINFTEEKVDKSVLQVGVSGAMLDIDRYAGFTGVAFGMLGGVFGIGLYTIVSPNIETRDASGVKTGDTHYVAGVSYFSYGWSFGISQIGVSLKGLYEKIDTSDYLGVGSDIGIQAYLFPFLKVGFVAQDLGSFLTPASKQENVESRVDVFYPTLRLGAAITTETGIELSLSVIKKLEQDGYEVNVGFQYRIVKYVSIYLGINDSYFSAGTTVRFLNINASYAFSFDKIDYGYNNTFSIKLMF
ncbi:hypothetical protein ACFL20_01460 [Spirochaetota bacterium]